jgi:hypothetical protein
MHFINIMNDTVEFQVSFRMIMVNNGVAGMSISKGVTKAAICQSIWPLFKRLEKGQTQNFGLQVAYLLSGRGLLANWDHRRSQL